MLTRDGAEIAWPHCRDAATTLTAGELRLLMRDADAAERCLAHARLTRPQLETLYRKSGYRYALKMRWIGRKLMQYGLEDYARGLSLFTLVKVVGSSRDRFVLIEKLLARS